MINKNNIDLEKLKLYLVSLLPEVIDETKRKIRKFNPIIGKSKLWKRWHTFLSPGTCRDCRDLNGHVYRIDENVEGPPIHYKCRCIIIALDTILNGTASIEGKEGADYYIYNYGFLPDKYVTKEEAEKLGWIRSSGNLYEINKLIGGDVYDNRDYKLPHSAMRTWYEADLNYVYGFRNDCRLLYSNDGLFFVTYDHYETFMELV